MAMLMRTARKRRPGDATPGAPATLLRTGAGVQAAVGGAAVLALPEGALWIETARAIVVADLHFEKGSAFAKAGQLLPPYDTHATLERLAGLVDRWNPEIVVSLGDAFHDGGGPARMDERDRALLVGLISSADWVWIEGNHEGKSAETLGGAAVEELRLGDVVLRHAPTGAAGEIAGHLHPSARVAGRGRSVRRRCFATDGQRMVMPAFGAYTGSLNICDEAFASVFPTGAAALVLGKDRVLPVPQERLLPD